MKMTSTKDAVATLLRWMQTNQPHVYAGLVNRFNPPGTNLHGLFDSISNLFSRTVETVSNFAGSQGFDKILTAAQPFLANKTQQSQLAMQIKAAQAGVQMPGQQQSQQGGSNMPAPSAPATASTGFSFGSVPPWAWALLAAGGAWALSGKRR